MSESTSFQDILKSKAADIQSAPVAPEGHYVLKVGGYQMGTAKSENKTPFANYDMGVTRPCQDVDMPESGIDFTKKKFFKKFYITEDAVFRMKKFLMACGVECEDTEDSLKECMDLAKGAEVIAAVTIETGKNGDEFNAVDGFIHIDELDTVDG